MAIAKQAARFDITGRVIDLKTKAGIADLKVEAWDKDLIFDDLLGGGVTGAEGFFHIEIKDSYYQEICFDRQPDIFFKIFCADQLIRSTENSILWNVTARETEVVIEVNIPESALRGQLKVRGKIVTDTGTAAGGLAVTAVDKSFGREVILGRGVSDAAGNYIILYSKELIRRTGKPRPDIEIRIGDPEDPAAIYGTSSVHYNAGNDERIDLAVDSRSLPAEPEYQRIIADLRPYIDSGSLKDLREDKDRQDISYLANKTGWDARLVAMASLAHRYSQESGIPAEFYYALFRAGLPTTVDRLYRTGADAVARIWKQAVERNLIDEDLKGQIDPNINQFKDNGTRHLLERARPVGISSLKEMLDISLPEASKQREFVEIYYHHRGEGPEFWTRVEEKFGPETSARLQLDGKLGYLTLNNAPLIARLRQGKQVENSPVDLIRNGLYRREAWQDLLTDGVEVPAGIPGDTEAEQRNNYIDYMVYRLKRDEPTAVVAEMVKNGDLPLRSSANRGEAVYRFFRDTHGRFEINRQPLGPFLRENEMQLEEETADEVKRLQRIFQISPSDQAMEFLWNRNLDSAFGIVQYGRTEFLERFGKDMGGDLIAGLTYDKARQIHSATLNIALSYLTYRTGPGLYATSGFPQDETAPGLAAYPTLEALFGALDYCSCQHCRSVLSPAAYLVDLLQFINLEKSSSGDLPTTGEGENPLDVLLKRRPDIEYLQLTCENTHTVLPYIDLVNEILEFYTVHNRIRGYEGHNVEGASSLELLADPRFVNDEAYTVLKEQVFPFDLPFDDPLETVRLYYNHLRVPLPEAMEKLRVNDRLDADPAAHPPNPYGWRDIYNESLGISPQEYTILTGSGERGLPAYFGRDEGMSFADFNLSFSNAKLLARTTAVSYSELIEIVKTRFINPHTHLIPPLEALEISLTDIEDFHDGRLSEAELDAKIPSHLDLSVYGGDIKEWLRNHYDHLMGLILLTETGEETAVCSFERLELRYALPDNTRNRLKEIDYWRLLRFIRLWKKMGGSIDETDAVIAGLFKEEFIPLPDESGEQQKEKLDNGFRDLLIRIAHLEKIRERLNLQGQEEKAELLKIWGGGASPDEGAAFLARALKLSLLELTTLTEMSGIDPLHQWEDVNPGTLRFMELVQLIQSAGINIMTLSYLLRHQDPTGNASPPGDDILAFARILKQGLVQIELEHTVEDDPGGEITQAKMALVYGSDAAGRFFGLLKGTTSYSVGYHHTEPELDEDWLGVSDKLVYDHYRKRLVFQGVMTAAVKTRFEDADSASESFIEAIGQLFEAGRLDVGNFFDCYPDLEALYDRYAGSDEPETIKMAAVLEGFLPALKRELKIRFIRQTLAAALNVEAVTLQELMENQAVLHAEESVEEPVVTDFLRLENCGISARYFFAGDIGESPDRQEVVAAGIDFSDDNPLPVDPAAPDDPVSAVWNLYLEVPANGHYNWYIETDHGAGVKFSIDDSEIPVEDETASGFWQNRVPVELQTGRLYRLELEIANVRHRALLRWERQGLGRRSVPVNHLYPDTIIRHFSYSYIRVLKALALKEGLGIDSEEMAFFGSRESFRIDGQGFLNVLPVTPEPDPGTVRSLFDRWFVMLRYVDLKKSLQVEDNALARILDTPEAEDDSGGSLLLKATGWSESSIDALLTRFNWNAGDLGEVDRLRRLNEACGIVKQFNAEAADLLDWTTPRADAGTVRNLRSKLRPRYDEPAWLEVLQTINDCLRQRRREALVSFVLQRMQQSDNDALKAIDTADKLFEFFLIDVKMDACMKTSRIKQAISSVQLFIQRCLMNLEPEVSPASIKADEWEWMKRYRVWEANRKVFLYPENWLEPELRDDKSPFFRELEGQLLQADITDDLAHSALLKYLEKLDEVSKLEICAVCLEGGDTGSRADDILHVIGRTSGASRKHYYRRLEYGYWTPWERMDLDIEDNPLLPVIWKRRLFLFWLNIVRKGSEGDTLPEDEGKTMPADLAISDLNQAVKESIEINLSWSEYYQGKWQPRKTSDFNKPIPLGEFAPAGFNRENVTLSYHISGAGDLRIYLRYGHLIHYFRLFNKHSVPVRSSEDVYPGIGVASFARGRTFEKPDLKLHVAYTYPPFGSDGGSEDFEHDVLTKPHLFDIVKTNHHVVNVFEAPFFYQERKHVFFVEPEEGQTTLSDFGDFGLYFPTLPSDDEIEFPPAERPPERPPGSEVALVESLPVDPPPDDVNMSDLPLSRILAGNRAVDFNGEAIGPLGSRHARFVSFLKIGGGRFERVVPGGGAR